MAAAYHHALYGPKLKTLDEYISNMHKDSSNKNIALVKHITVFS